MPNVSASYLSYQLHTFLGGLIENNMTFVRENRKWMYLFNFRVIPFLFSRTRRLKQEISIICK